MATIPDLPPAMISAILTFAREQEICTVHYVGDSRRKARETLISTHSTDQSSDPVTDQ